MDGFKIDRNGGRGRGRRAALAVIPMLVVALGACDELLEVDLPGAVTVEALDNPDLARTLVLGAQGDFECGLVDYIWYPGQWFELFLNTSGSRPDGLSGLRSRLIEVYADPCDSGTGPIWTVLQVPRGQAVRAIELLNSENFAEVANRSELIAEARLYEAYSIQLLAEQFCEITIDAGPKMSREEGYALAAERFTQAIEGGTPDVVAAAYIGRARSKLNTGGDPTGVIADASNPAIREGFQLVATYDASVGRRNNRIPERNIDGESLVPASTYGCIANPGVQQCPHGEGWLTFAEDGTTVNADTGDPLIKDTEQDEWDRDPRVPIVLRGDVEGANRRIGPRGTLVYRLQQKYPNEGTSIPFSTWREAQLMIAEAQIELGNTQAAVDIINELRTNTAGLPDEIDPDEWPLKQLSATDAETVRMTVLEERRRELWMQGVIFGDKLRNGYPVWEDTDEYGQSVSPGSCFRIPFLEETSNPNL